MPQRSFMVVRHGPIAILNLLILIDKDKITTQDRQAITYPLYDVEIETGVIISPKVFSRKHWENVLNITPFYHNVMKDKTGCTFHSVSSFSMAGPSNKSFPFLKIGFESRD